MDLYPKKVTWSNCVVEDNVGNDRKTNDPQSAHADKKSLEWKFSPNRELMLLTGMKKTNATKSSANLDAGKPKKK